MPELQLLGTPGELRERCQAWRSEGHEVGLVPTMGALHRGHLELVRAALRDCSRVVVSIFVNPLQFGSSVDLASYPRDLAADLQLLRREGVHACYCPAPSAVYPAGFATAVEVELGSELWEARSRPGHFRGVATIVTKLLAASGPCRAYFGEKDAQQVLVVRRLAQDLDLGVEIAVQPVVREEDGLALSSRNRLLSGPGRRAAACLYRALEAARAAFAQGSRSGEELARVAAAVVEAEPLAQLDYAGVVNPGDFSPLARAESGSRVLLAARVDSVRLIDTGLLGAGPDRLG